MAVLAAMFMTETLAPVLASWDTWSHTVVSFTAKKVVEYLELTSVPQSFTKQKAWGPS